MQRQPCFGLPLYHAAHFLKDLPLPVHLVPTPATLESQLLTCCVRLQRVALLDVASQELLGQRILQVFLHSTAHGSSAVGWIVSLIDEQLDCAPIQVNLDILGFSGEFGRAVRSGAATRFAI